MIIDFRMRPPYRSFLDTNGFNPRPVDPDPVGINGLLIDMPYQRSFEERSMEAFLEEMDEAGIDLGVVTGRKSPAPFFDIDNDHVFELVEQHPDRFVGIGAVDPWAPDALDEIDEIADRGGIGLMTNPMWNDPPIYDDSPQMDRIYAKAVERGLLISSTGSVFMGPDNHYCHPEHLQRAALRFPELTFVVGHGAWPWTTLLCGVALQCPNVVLMPDIYVNIPNTPGAEVFVEAANSYLSHRFLFATAYPVRGMVESVAWGRDLGFASDEIRDRAMGGNAARLLGLDPAAPGRLERAAVAAG